MSVPSPIEVRRDEDDELLGLLLPAGAGRWVPATIFGAALAPAADEELAESVVREHGLSSRLGDHSAPPPVTAAPRLTNMAPPFVPSRWDVHTARARPLSTPSVAQLC